MAETLVVDREFIEEIPDFSVLISKYAGQSEQRRLTTSKEIVGFRIVCPHFTYAQMRYIRDFHTARYGAAYGFNFLSPFTQTTYTVRFEPGTFKIRLERGTFRCEFTLIVINQDEI